MYDSAFYDRVDRIAARAADSTIAVVLRAVAVRSVVDFGCGRGAWLAAWTRAGVPHIAGVDGAWVDAAQLRIAPSDFRAADLAQPVDLHERFDLAQSVEVAEHLPRGGAPLQTASRRG